MKPAAYLIMVAMISSASALASTPAGTERAPGFQAAQSKAQAPEVRATNIEAAIRAVADLYTKATMAGDAKAIAMLYTEDAVEMPPNQPIVKGRAAIQQYYEKQFAGGKIARFALSHLETRAVGDTGYDVGTYRQNVTPTGAKAFDDTGKYAVILKRGPAGWKVAYAIYSSDRPSPAGPSQ
jgi:uncharacterized protein (TIGR02246 family)